MAGLRQIPRLLVQSILLLLFSASTFAFSGEIASDQPVADSVAISNTPSETVEIPQSFQSTTILDEIGRPDCAVCEAGNEGEGTDEETKGFHFYADYDDGFVIRAFDPKQHPYELKINGWVQFRHIGFARDIEFWTDNAGITRPVLNRNDWDVERARLIFSGFTIDERLTYFVHIDGDTDGGDIVDFLDFWYAWRFSDRFQLQMGKRKVTANRQWLLTARNTRLVDRPMADEFFRPDRTVGIFGVGRLGNLDHFEIMIGDGYRTSNLPPSELDDQFTYAATHYWDPLGDFGPLLVDYHETEDPLVRLGHSFVYSPQDGLDQGTPTGEADFVRLTDGTRLTETGALAPGVTVSEFTVYYYSVDVAAKWLGWSFDSEIFLRWIDNLDADGPLPVSEIYQQGFFVEGGKFLIEKTLDFNLRYSFIDGDYGSAASYAAGFNWFPIKTNNKLKITFDVTEVERSPVQSNVTDILVGDDGTLFRTQFQAEF